MLVLAMFDLSNSDLSLSSSQKTFSFLDLSLE